MTYDRGEEDPIYRNNSTTEKLIDNNEDYLNRKEKEKDNNNEGKINVDVDVKVCDIYRNKNDTQSTNNRDDRSLIGTGKIDI